MTSVTTHHQFINETLPAWYVNATEHTRQLLNSDMVLGHQLREQLGKALAPVKPLDAFARPLLIEALEEEFGPGLDIDKTYFFKHIYKPGKFGELELAAPEVCLQTLLHVALQNFHQEEVDEPHRAGKVQIVEIKQVVDTRYGTYDQYPPHPMNVDPARFMSLCRKLDLGGKYQAHLDSVFGPDADNSSEGTGFTAEQIADLFGRKEHNALKVQAHIAYMRNDIPEAFYQQMLGLPERSRSGTLNYFCLKICGFSVRDILIFQIRGERTCVVYVPGEPNTSMKAFSSFDELKRLLSQRFTPAYCKAFMNRFIAQRSKAGFFNKVAERIAPAHVQFDPDDSTIIPRLIYVREVDLDFDLDIELDEIPYDLFTHFHFQKMLRIKDDARVLAVPTDDENEESRRARLAGYVAMGMNVANFAALFVPLLGEAMMVVAGAQLLTETFQGVGAWSHADMHEALEHLGSVAQNLAFMAAFGALVKAGTAPEIPAVKGSSFVGKMVPIKLPNGETRLWSPDLTPFAHDIVPPQGAQLSGEGVFTHEDKHYLPLDGRFYPINYDPALNKWRIEPPRGESFSPMLEHNGVGGWRHEGENPVSWDTRTSFKRLGPEAATLPDSLIDTVMEVTATDNLGLLELHLNNQPPPPGLADAILRFKVDQEVCAFYRQINDVAALASANPQLQMELLVAMPRWPVGRPIEVLDAQGLKIAEYGSSVQLPNHPNLTRQIRPFQVTQAQIAEGKLLPAMIDGLGEGGQNRVFGRSATRTSENLALEMARFAEGRSSWMFDRLYQARDANSDPLINLLKRDFPSLPTAAARELIAQATAEQGASMTAFHRIPLEIAGRARGYVQEIRLNRALEGFCLASKADNPDTLKVALHLLERLPGWPGDIRIEVRDGAADGPLLESLAQESATQRRILVKRGLDYRAVDASGGEISPGVRTHNNFFSAVLQALPEAARQALGFPDLLLDAERLRLRIITCALRERETVSRILGQWKLSTGFRAPFRLADGRIGYVLSGRGSSVSEGTDDLALLSIMQTLYPESPDIHRFVDGLLWRTGQSAGEIRASVLETQRSFEVLRTALEGWVEPPQGSTSQAALARRAVAESISRTWRGMQLHSPLGHSALTLESIDFSLLSDLPDLPEHYAAVDRIFLSNITADVEQLDGFLARFPGLVRLELMSSELSRLPDVLSRLPVLSELSLESMGMTVDQGLMNQLMELRHLSMLDLSGNRFGELTETTRLTAVRLYLRSMQLTRWPEWVDDWVYGCWMSAITR